MPTIFEHVDGCPDQALPAEDWSARVIGHPDAAYSGEIVAICWKCCRIVAFSGCHTYTRIPAYGGATIIFQPDRYYAACPNCGAVQLSAENATSEQPT